ncbi:MAG: hypothetical protein M1468_03465 [Candidatus Thermoplasmatota archaeon]|nr:hypothetical protein [Candidatus Thermoplasmatota archaeon]
MIASAKDIVHIVSSLLARDEPPVEIRILSFKKDRSITLRMSAGDTVEVSENGFDQKTFNCSKEALPKLIEEVSDREFPRSHRVRISLMKK